MFYIYAKEGISWIYHGKYATASECIRAARHLVFLGHEVEIVEIDDGRTVERDPY